MKTQLIRKETDALRAPMIKDIIPSILLFVISRGRVLGFYPFGIAFFCACFDKSCAYLGITLMYLGLISAGAGNLTVKYIISSLCFWIFSKFMHSRTERTGSLFCSLSLIIGGAVNMLYTGFSMYSAVMLIAEAAAVFLMYEVFSKSEEFARNSHRKPLHDELISCAIALGVLIMSISDFSLPYQIKPSNILAVYALLLVSMTMNTSASGVMGITTGFIAGINSDAITLSGIMGLGAVFSSLLKGFKKLGIAAGFFCGFLVSLFYVKSTDLVPVSVIDVVLGCAVFMCTPNKVFAKLSELFVPPSFNAKSVEARAVFYLQSRIEDCSKAFSSLKDVFEKATKKRMEMNDTQTNELFDKIASCVCTDCSRFARCYECSFNDTYNMFMEIFNKIESKGAVSINNLPLSYRDRCLQLESLVNQFLHIYEKEKIKKVHLEEMKTGRDLCALQYGEIADILDKINADVNEGFVYCPEFEALCANELFNYGIDVKSIDISQNRYGKYEIILHVEKKTDMNICEKLISKVLMTNIGVESTVSDGIYRLVSMPRYSVDIGTSQKSKEEICGDSISIFTTDDHKLYCIISDGMGCGAAAQAESDITVTMLREFISAGFSVETSISMINSSMCLKADTETFSTVDLAEVDLITGIVQCYKIGSAISLLYSDGEVSSLYSISLPVGMLPHLQIKSQTKKLDDANILLMVSDGITEAGEIKTDWLKAELKTPFGSMQELSDSVLDKAIQKSGGNINDDMSVIAIMLKING